MTELQRRLFRAFEHRFGKAVRPLKVQRKCDGDWRVFDPQTGTWADFTQAGTRLRCVAEHKSL
ncbi:hypothetical protein [Microvirga massiliensis]|uniref:hypothetical protein n=1 Tax=Microvirga massiliensis TaxID=1033741 RepID=UPI00062B3FF4|nr:hypothetical protein [Microvirga massiliensis]